MQKTLIATAFAALMALAAPGNAADSFASDLGQCKTGQTPQLRVEGCMGAIGWGTMQGETLAAAFAALATALEEAGEPSRAAAAATEAIRLNPTAGRYYLLRALIVGNSDGCASAMPDFDSAIALSEASAQLHYLRGSCYPSEEAARALVDFDTALRLDPAFYMAYFGRAAALVELDRLDGALATANAGIELVPDLPEGYVHRAAVHVARKDVTLAKADLAKALTLDEAFVPALNFLADLTYRDGQIETALGYYDRILAVQPDNAGTLNNRCYLAAELGRLDAAMKDCEASIAAGANGVNLDSRGFVHLKRGDYIAARADFDAALAHDAKMPSSLYGRGIALLRLGQTSEGQADIAAAIALDADIAAFYDKNGLKP